MSNPPFCPDEPSQLEDKEAFLERVLNTMDQPVISTDVVGCILYWNRSAEEHFGYTRDEVIGTSIIELGMVLISPEEQFWIFGPATTSELRTGTFECKRKDGKVIEVYISNYPIVENGEHLGFTAIVTDPTEQKRKERELRQARNNWRNIFQAIGHPTIILGKDHRIYEANKAALERTGLTIDEIRQKKCHEIFHSSNMPPGTCPMEHLLDSGKLETEIMEQEALGGWFLVSCTPILDDEGNVEKIIHIATDVSEKKMAEEALKASEERFRAIFDHAHDGMLIADVEQKRFVMVNEKMSHMLGYSKEEVLELGVMDIHPPEDIPKVIKAFDKQTRQEKEVARELPVLRNDGSVFYADISAFPIEIGGRVLQVGFFRDVTDRMESEKALGQTQADFQETSQMLESLFNAIPDVLGIQDPDHGIIRYNKAGYEFLNLTQKDVHGKRCFELIGRSVPCEVCATSEVYRTKEPARIEKFIEDSGVWLEVRAYPVLDENGEIVRVIEHLRDITERKEARRSMEEANRMLRLVLDTIPVRVFWKDMGSRYLGCNQLFADDAGKTSPDQIIGKDDNEMVWNDRAEQFRTDDREVIDTGTAKLNYEEPGTRENGEETWIRTSKVPLLDDNSNVMGVLGTYDDITEKKKAEEALVASEEKYRALFENSPESIIMLDLNGNIIDFNENALELSKLPEDQIRGRSFMEVGFIQPELLDKYFGVFQKMIEGDDVEPFEIEIPTTNKGTVWLEVFPAFMKKDGEVYAIQVITRDITERKRTQQRILDERNRSELYLDLLSHDISNQNQGVMAYLELALDDIGFSIHSREYIQKSLVQAISMANLVKNVNNLAAIEEGRFVLEPVDVKQLLDQAIPKVRSFSPGRKIDVIYSMDDGEVKVMGNDLLEDVFQNLLGNAVKFDKNQDVRVDIGHSLSEDGMYWKLEFKDNGVGVSDNIKEKIFGRLDRGDKTVHGSGLGLAIIKRIVVDMCEGKVWVEDKVEGDRSRGANFIVEIPRG